jgi:hypothetical protein
VIHPIKVAFESIYMSRPEPAELSQPGIQLLKWFRFQPVETALCVHRGFYETRLSQYSQVLGHGRLRHTKLTLDLSHRLLGRNQEAQYRTAVWLRNDFEYRFHLFNIPYTAYTCQGIYRKGARHCRYSSRDVHGDSDRIKDEFHSLHNFRADRRLAVIAIPSEAATRNIISW